MSETGTADPAQQPEDDILPHDTRLDEDDRLKPEFVSAVLDHVDEGHAEQARDLVRPLHPADIADLFELTPSDQRVALATALGDLVTAVLMTELNDYVCAHLIGAPPPLQVAEIATPLDTHDALPFILTLQEVTLTTDIKSMHAYVTP